MIIFNKSKINEYSNISLVLLTIVFTVIYSSLNIKHRLFVAKLLTNDFILVATIIIITIFSYYYIIGGFIISVIYIIMILPYLTDKLNNNINNNNSNNSNSNNVTEGFNNKNSNIKSNKKFKKIKVGGPEGTIEEEDINLFTAISGKGNRVEKFMKKIDNYKKHKKRENTFNNLNSNSSKYNSHTDSYKEVTKYNKNVKINEEINENDIDIIAKTAKNNKSENFNTNETIRIRKFNPNDEFDNNLLMTKDICDDIKKRIIYEYESIPYLKQYISSRLQEIIDLLDLSA
jgi:hypothetical protein